MEDIKDIKTDNAESACCAEEAPQNCCECCRHKHTPRGEQEMKQLRNRINRIIGQMNGIQKMLDENRRGADLPPIAASLHMPSGYTKIFAQRLDGTLDLRVKEAENGERPKRSSVYIAPGSKHMRIAADTKGCFLSVAEGAKISGHCPSVDALFESAAQVEFEKVIAVLLTGMGSDGAKGLLKLRERGARTIGQDQKTSLVYGMPKAAFELGAVEKQCALENIAGEICRLLKG